MVNITEEEVKKLQAEGYSMQEIQSAIKEIETEQSPLGKEYKLAMQDRGTIGSMQSSAFQYNPTDNLIKWQLELNDILERAEHILREDIVIIKEGNITWENNPEPEKRIFNEYGVQEIMRVLSMYINRNTILSDYEPKEINDKVYDFGKEVNDLIFMKYENFGLTTLEKRKNYPILVRELIDIVHSSYKRAQYGGERESLRTARNIQQQEQIVQPNMNLSTGEPLKERGLINPLRYIRGKYAT